MALIHIQPQPRRPSRPLVRNTHRDEGHAAEFILETLQRRPEGVPQNQLVKHHEPAMVERLLDRLIGRGLVTVVFDRKVEGGSSSRIIRLAHRQQEKK